MKPEVFEECLPRIERLPRGYRLRCAVFLPHRPEDLFPFFADAANLERITPPFLHFRVLTPLPIAIQAGRLIDYRLRLHGIPVRWRTRIRDWRPPHVFVDEQVRGPYRWWIHEHKFEAVPNGTLCRDRVDYGVPGGRLIHRLFVARDVLRIFAYRQQILRDLFGRAAATP